MYFAPNYQKHVESLITLFQPRSQVATILIVICITTGSPSSSSLRELNWEFSWEPEKKIEVKSLFQEVAFRILVSQHQGFFMKGAAHVSSDLCLFCSFVLDHEVRTHNSKVLDRFMTKTEYNKIIYFHVSSSLTVCGGRRMRNFTIYILVFALNEKMMIHRSQWILKLEMPDGTGEFAQ